MVTNVCTNAQHKLIINRFILCINKCLSYNVRTYIRTSSKKTDLKKTRYIKKNTT